ncbi:MAG: ribosome assembly RNA-binding protein YhbY [Desulfobulbaceae bacterium]
MKKKKEQPCPDLSGRQKRYLRSLGHHLAAVVIVGREGITDNLIGSCAEGLDAHELIKVKLGQNCPLEKKQAATELAEKTGACMVQLIGRTILLYRPNRDLPRGRVGIELPR